MQLSQAKIISNKDLGHTIFLLRSDGIVESQCADNFTYEVQHIIENLEYLKTLVKEEKLLILNCVAPFTQISTEARDLLASGTHSNIIKAEAFVIHSLAQKLIAQFFIKVNKPVVKANYFKDKREAEKWLLKC